MGIYNTILIIVVIIVLIWGFIKWMSRPLRHRVKNLDELERFLQGLIIQGAEGSILIVKDKKTKMFVQFVKLGKKNRAMLHFGFPDAPWSRRYFQEVEDAFKIRNIQYSINQTGEDVVTKFLDIDIVKIDKAVKIAKIAFNAMHIPPSGHFQAYYEGDLDEDYLKELKQEFHRARKKKKGKTFIFVFPSPLSVSVI